VKLNSLFLRLRVQISTPTTSFDAILMRITV